MPKAQFLDGADVFWRLRWKKSEAEIENIRKACDFMSIAIDKTYEEVRDAYAKTVPIGRLGLPEDVAALTAFLATEEAKYITGQFISTSGGR